MLFDLGFVPDLQGLALRRLLLVQWLVLKRLLLLLC